MITHSEPLIFPSVEFLVTVRVFHCPQTTTLSQAFLYCVISFYLWGCLLYGGERYLVCSWLCGGCFVSARLLCTLPAWRCIPGWKSSSVMGRWQEQVLGWGRSLKFPIYVRPFGPFSFWLSKQATEYHCELKLRKSLYHFASTHWGKFQHLVKC